MVSDEDVFAETQERMQKSADALKRELNSIRTGRASPALIEGLSVEYYGSATTLNQLASISVPEARLLVIQPWDKQSLGDVERAILTSDLGLVPNSDGTVIRISIPQLTEERRRDLVKLVGKKVEEAHVSVRNVRRDILEKLRSLEKDKTLSQDDSRRSQQRLQQATDAFIEAMDRQRREKEAEVMEV